MEKMKTPRDSAFVTRKIVKPDELNPNGTLFGGVVMSWIDEVAFMSARRYSGRAFVVTASIDNITFLAPLRLGEHVLLTSQVNYVGRSSMEIGVKVEKEDPYTGKKVQATSAYLTFVALDKRMRPRSVPRLKLETPEDHRRFDEAKLRVRVRDRLRRRLRKKYEEKAHDPTLNAQNVQPPIGLGAVAGGSLGAATSRFSRLGLISTKLTEARLKSGGILLKLRSDLTKAVGSLRII
jgi:acyl-CoA hydrolase